MYCIKCGSQIEDDAKFCYKCGEKTEKADMPVSVLDSNEKKPKNNKKALISIVSLCVIVAVVTGTLHMKKDKPVSDSKTVSTESAKSNKPSDSNNKTSQVPTKETPKFNLADHFGHYYRYDYGRLSETLKKCNNESDLHHGFLIHNYLDRFKPPVSAEIDEMFFDFGGMTDWALFDVEDFKTKEKDGGMYYYNIKDQIAFLFKDDSIEVYMPDIIDMDHLEKAMEKTTDDAGFWRPTEIFLTDNPDQFFKIATYIKVPDSYKGRPDIFEWDDAFGDHWYLGFDVS